MKSFKKFWEDTKESKQNPKTIDREDEAARNLEARRDAAKRRADQLMGPNDTEARLKRRHELAKQKDAEIRAELESEKDEQPQRSSSSLGTAVTQSAKRGIKSAGKALVKGIKNKVNTNPQSSS